MLKYAHRKDMKDENSINNEIIALPDFWENADKDELLFLLENMIPSYSSVLTESLSTKITTNVNYGMANEN